MKIKTIVSKAALSKQNVPESPSIKFSGLPLEAVIIEAGHVSGFWIPGEKMNGKPVIYRLIRTALTIPSVSFHEKHLCDGIVFNSGDGCAFSCTFCYVEAAMRKLVKPLIDEYNRRNGTRLGYQDLVVRRYHACDVIKWQLFDKKGNPRYNDPADNRVVYSSTLVDVAGNKALLKETAEICNLILSATHWQIRLLSKSALLKDLVSKEMIPKKYHHRLIFGFSTGTLDEKITRAIEKGTSSITKRLEALHWLQDNGFRSFGMICPSLPQKDYREFSRSICEAIRVDRCEEVWAEVINVRGETMSKTLKALNDAGYEDQRAMLEAVSGEGNSAYWENYARDTFLGHTEFVPTGKLRFLQYVGKDSADWWANNVAAGAVLIGAEAKRLGLTSIP